MSPSVYLNAFLSLFFSIARCVYVKVNNVPAALVTKFCIHQNGTVVWCRCSSRKSAISSTQCWIHTALCTILNIYLKQEKNKKKKKNKRENTWSKLVINLCNTSLLLILLVSLSKNRFLIYRLFHSIDFKCISVGLFAVYYYDSLSILRRVKIFNLDCISKSFAFWKFPPQTLLRRF